MRIPVLLAATLTLTACGDGVGSGNVTAAAPVAAASAPAGQNWVDTVVKTPDGGFLMGNPNAPIKFVEYGARSCPTCGAFGREATRPLEEKYVASGKVSYEFRDFLVHGAPDLAAALLGQCGGTGPFFSLLEQGYIAQNDYLDKLQAMTPADQQRLTSGTPAQGVTLLAEKGGLLEFVKQRGIPEAKARACLNDQAAIEALAKSTEKWGQDGTVTGTPTFYINGERVNAADWRGVETALKAAGA
ncbi:MAG: thioredoxin domain-containing protein [Pseudomonadota bacterium]